jgi:hypothetical protein
MSQRFVGCAIMLRRFGCCMLLYPTFRILSVLLLCSDISETVFAYMLRRIGGYLFSYTRRLGDLLLCSDVSDSICALKLLRFGCCLLLVCSDVSETAILLRRLRGYLCFYARTFRRNISIEKLSVFADLTSRIRRIAG